MKKTVIFAAMGAMAAILPAQDVKPEQGPIVTARDDQPVEASSEDQENDGRFYLGLGAGNACASYGEPKAGIFSARGSALRDFPVGIRLRG